MNVGQGERLGSLLAGLVLIGRAFSRPTWGRIAAGVGGAMLLKRAITGHCEVKESLGIGQNQQQRVPVRAKRRPRKDPVSEASEESFPASDPPAWTPVAGTVAREYRRGPVTRTVTRTGMPATLRVVLVSAAGCRDVAPQP
jgi:hypothetical protein